VVLEDDPEVPAALDALAKELLADPDSFRRQLGWLLSDEAEYGNPLLGRLGEADRGGPLFEALREAAGTGQWATALAVYCAGWARTGTDEVDDALDRRVEDPALHAGILVATTSLPPARRRVERLIRLVAARAVPRAEAASEIALRMRWELVPPADMEHLVSLAVNKVTILGRFEPKDYARPVSRRSPGRAGPGEPDPEGEGKDGRPR
jgi:hypothetical protein